MTWVELLAWSLVMAVGLTGSALCSGIETAFYTVNRVRVDIAATGPAPRKSAKILSSELDHPERALATLLIGNNMANYAGAAAITAMLASSGFTDAAIIVINALILTPVLVIFCESLPKELFRQHADRLAPAFAPALATARIILTIVPVLPMVLALGRAVVRLMGVSAERWADLTARERLAHMLQEGAAQGALSPSQASLVERALAMRDATVEDEMTPWNKVRTLRHDWPRERVLRESAGRSQASLPVVNAHGRVVGVLWAVDAHLRHDAPWQTLIHEPARLASSVSLLDAMQYVTDSPARVGIVEREGRPVGLVTPQDLIEPLTGEWAER